MKLPSKPANEADRLADLQQYAILDTGSEPDFDMLVELASRICETPISTLTLVDSDRQWFKARLGVEDSQTERGISFCAHAILQNDLLVVNDASSDERFADNPLVTDNPHIRFYAGAQIVSAKGHKLGTLCVIDTKPRELNWHQASALRILSNQASRLLELRRLKQQQQPAAPTPDLSRMIALLVDQLRNSTNTLERSLDPLRTGKFTKKQLSHSYAEAAAILRRNERLGSALRLLGTLENPDVLKPAEDIALAPLFARIDEELAAELKKKPTSVQVGFAEDFALRQYAPLVYGVLKGLIHFFYSHTKEDVSVAASHKGRTVDLRFSLIYSNLVSELRQYESETVFIRAVEEDGEGSALAHDLFLLRIILKKMGGQWEVAPLGAEGTQVVVQFPVLP